MSEIPEEAKLAFKGKMFEVWQWDQKMFDGTTQIYETIRRANTVEVITVTEDGKILLLEQEQPHKSKPFISLPGGRVEEGELPEDAVRRELREETGYDADNFELIKTCHPSGSIDWIIFLYVARNARIYGKQDLDPGEKIKVLPVSFEEFLNQADKNSFRHFLIKADLVRAKYDPVSRKEWEKKLFG